MLLKKFGQAVLLLFVAFMMAVPVFGQATVVVNIDTVGNSVAKSGTLLNIEAIGRQYGYSHVDSVSLGIYAQGEVDLDTLEIYPGFVGTYSSNVSAVSQAATDTTGYTLTVNLDSAKTGYVYVGTYPQASLKGYNALYYYTAGSASGCDATDPGQKVWLVARVWGTK